MKLFFDTETTGLFENDHIPRLIQLSLLYTEDNGKERGFINILVKPEEDWVMTEGAQNVHGISLEDAGNYGVSEATAVSLWYKYLRMSDEIIAHNIKYDLDVMEVAYKSVKNKTESMKNWEGFKEITNDRKKTCTMYLADPILNLPPTIKMIRAGYGDKSKVPKLIECYQHFFNEPFNAHNAGDDVRACSRVYFHIINNNLHKKSI